MEKITPQDVSKICRPQLEELVKTFVPTEILQTAELPALAQVDLLNQLVAQLTDTINKARQRLTGLYIGRFQPFHNGHLSIILRALEECDELIIGVGSPYQSHSEKNPFTAAERIEMIRESLREAGIPLEKFQIVTIPDIGRPALWAKHVASITPPFGRVYSGSTYVAQLFKEEGGYEVKKLPLLTEGDERISATRIRESMMDNPSDTFTLEGTAPWQQMVPPAVVRIIQEIGGEERLRAVLDK